MDDKKIVELFFERDEQALKIVEQKYGGLCFCVANNILHSHSEAEECVNDTYLAAWDSIPPQRPNKLSAFLAKIVRNKALNRCERENSMKRGGSELKLILSELNEDISSKDDTEELFNEHLVTDIINEYLHSVSKSKAAIFIQRYFMCFSVDEIAENTGRSYNSIVTSLHRMRNELKQKLKNGGVEL